MSSPLLGRAMAAAHAVSAAARTSPPPAPQPGGLPEPTPTPPRGFWRRLSARIDRWSGRTCDRPDCDYPQCREVPDA